METAALLTLAKLKNIKASAILNNVVEYHANLSNSILEFSQAESITQHGELQSIILALESLSLASHSTQ